MRSRATIWYLFGFFLAAVAWIGFSARASLAGDGADEVLVPVPTPTPTAPTVAKESWLILPSMPADATAADIGAEIYTLVCRDCHGDRGQGLTDAFRATWAPKDQNCWQSKCHAPNHPPEGFELPRYVPAIIGAHTLTRFRSAAELETYISTNMPWHNPGALTAAEYQQLTAYILRESKAQAGS
jgi:mono/diheme cytochrome c family protein